MFLRIVNWEKYNPRHDIKKSSWFRLENTFWADPAISPLDNDGKMIWVTLLSLASAQQGAPFELDFDFTRSLLKVSLEKFQTVLSHLQDRGRIELATSRPRNAHVTSTLRSRAGATRRDETVRDGTKRETEIYPPKSAPKPEAPADIELADLWAQFAREVSRTVKPDTQKWAATVRLLREKDGFTHDELRSLLAFAKADDFWRVQVSSLPALRTRSKNGLLKVENLKAAAAKHEAAGGWVEESQEDRLKIYEGLG